MIILIFLIVFIGITYLGIVHIPSLIEWTTHKDMVKSQVKSHQYPIKRGNFETFLSKMRSKEWTRETTFPNSFFIKSTTTHNYSYNYVHASIITFDGVCMQLDYFSFIKFQEFIKQHKTYVNTNHWKL